MYKVLNLYACLGGNRYKWDELSDFHDYYFKKYKGNQRVDKIARNLVDYEAGRTIFETVLGIEKNKKNQGSLFDLSNK